jgi:hypothetical protein
MKPPCKKAFYTQGDDYGGSPEGIPLGHMTDKKQL